MWCGFLGASVGPLVASDGAGVGKIGPALFSTMVGASGSLICSGAEGAGTTGAAGATSGLFWIVTSPVGGLFGSVGIMVISG